MADEPQAKRAPESAAGNGGAASSRFAEQVIIVTGGADGLGKAITERLSTQEGARAVAIFDIAEESKGKAVAQAMTDDSECSGEVVYYRVDVSDEASVKEAVTGVVARYERLDAVVNCAGIVGPNGVKVADVSLDDFDRVYRVNLRGSFLITKHCIPHMLERNYGRVLLIASIAGKEGNAGMCAYSTSKAGVIGLAKAVGKEYAETGVTVNALAPGVVRTAMVEAMEPQQVQYMTDKIPMKRCCRLDEVASTVCFIISNETSFNTGYCFDLSGGRATY
eukprot:scpid94681/ scgid17888/ 3-oxoacyl-[acyl-carrier-protein] reductase FabG; 3-ketoacyl-acyl carrier protein reductase; Beta-Ketoacyl-acyl carrier protein reductase; Beta-ketoacyl-ACP reductase